MGPHLPWNSTIEIAVWRRRQGRLCLGLNREMRCWGHTPLEQVKSEREKNEKAREGEKKCFCPGSNRGPCACEAHVITATPQKLSCVFMMPLHCVGGRVSSIVRGLSRPWDSLGMARFSLIGLLDGQRMLKLTAPITAGPRAPPTREDCRVGPHGRGERSNIVLRLGF